jgi:hypothetical protein
VPGASGRPYNAEAVVVRTDRGGVVVEGTGNRRIDRIRQADYASNLPDLSLDEVRARRDECRGELEYLSLLRRMVQGRAEILKAEVERRRDPEDAGSLIDRLAEILTPEEAHASSRGEAVHVGVPDEEMTVARRRVERLVADAGISDPGGLNDDQLSDAAELLFSEERNVSAQRAEVIAVLDAVQDELKRRYKEDVSQVLS